MKRAVFRNVYQFQDAPEARHHSHEVEILEELRLLDEDDPDSLGAYVRCCSCNERFLAFGEEIEEMTTAAPDELTEEMLEESVACEYPQCDKDVEWMYHHGTQCRTFTCDEHAEEAKLAIEHLAVCPKHDGDMIDCLRCGEKAPMHNVRLVHV